jgi:AraC-like DNA-binding protein
MLLRLRPILPGRTYTDEQISQLAYSAGYEHHSWAHRDFAHMFGLGPGHLRALFRRAGVIPIR